VVEPRASAFPDLSKIDCIHFRLAEHKRLPTGRCFCICRRNRQDSMTTIDLSIKHAAAKSLSAAFTASSARASASSSGAERKLKSDPVLRHLVPFLSSDFVAANSILPLVFEHINLAISAYLVRNNPSRDRKNEQPCRRRLAPWQERLACELLADHFESALPLAEIAGKCGLSQAYFARAFKLTTGFSPSGWLQYSRVERAKEILQGSSAPLARIANECGFSDQSHFNRIFKRLTGTTPATWRRLHGQETVLPQGRSNNAS
jgi:AraC family transcriptional regulator